MALRIGHSRTLNAFTKDIFAAGLQLLLCDHRDHATISAMIRHNSHIWGERTLHKMLATFRVKGASGILWMILFFPGSQAFALEDARSAAQPEASYSGSQQCAACHPKQFQLWQQSHHARAMLPATEASVRADFNDTKISHQNLTAHFWQRDDNYFVTTQGVDGQLEKYQVRYTFGYAPLQQYLVEFPGGRLQVLPWAWDTQHQRWYYLQDPIPEPDDWLHWTRGAGNWNSMCADCHSTSLQKNYDPETNRYATQWAEVNVGCEACHGPGAKHIALAKSKPDQLAENPQIAMAGGLSAVEQVEQCGRCHSRRSQVTDRYDHESGSIMNHYLPEVLRPGLYHADGQINDEVFVYGSFTQSKMYQQGVACNSCHNVHSGSLHRKGNALCTSCHQPEQYDNAKHHHHPEASPGAECVGCHMPGKYYMGVDFRHDHSLRVPRPDLSARFGTPNACNRCHEQETAGWAANTIAQWFGAQRQPHFSDILAAAPADLGVVLPEMVGLLEDQTKPAVARATAVFWLAQAVHLEPVQSALIKVIGDQSALVRVQVVRALENLPAVNRVRLLSPLLEDSVRSVRIAALAALADIPDHSIQHISKKTISRARTEHRIYMEENADFASGQGYIALYHEKQQRFAKAKAAYRRALAIDNRDTASRINLAHLHYRLKEYREAEQAFKKAIHYAPDFGPAYYSLGLLLAELKNYNEAENYLEQALRLMPENQRVAKNLKAVRFYLNR